MLIFVKMQKDVKQTKDECFPMQNTQIDQFYLWRHIQKIILAFLNTAFIKIPDFQGDRALDLRATRYGRAKRKIGFG